MELHLKLQSDATLGRGDGVTGLVDEEVEHDPITGLPFLRGRTLKGLLVEECANILFALQGKFPAVEKAAAKLFGQAGSTLDDDGRLRVGAAQLPEEIRKAVLADVKAQRLSTNDVLESLTTIRRQTAVDEASGAPATGSLRAMRVLLHGTPLVAELGFDGKPQDAELGLLAACVLALRHAGTGRNRGRGRVAAHLHENGQDVTTVYFDQFMTLVGVPKKEAAHEGPALSH
jgi:hypothetical protein